MNELLKYPVGVQSFEKLRKLGHVYIDKTRFVYQLANYSQYIFLSRPRRFGKSLLLSTFQAYFEGKKGLFKGLEIEDMEKEMYRLGVPNREVKKGFYQELASAESGISSIKVKSNMMEMRKAFDKGHPDDALKILKAYMAGIPYHLTQNKPEIYFENNLYLILSLVGVDVRTEWQTSDGRIDTVLKTSKYVYVIELKLNGSPQKAMNQIEEKDYAAQFATDGRKIIRIGVNISAKTHTITDWEVMRG